MNILIEAWNSIARVWWSWCLHSTWQGLVLLVLVLAVLPLLRRISPHWRYALLLVALLKFVLPPLGMEGVGLFAWLFPPAQVTIPDPGPLNRLQFQIVSIENYAVDTSPVQVSAPKSSLHPLTPAGWGLLVHSVGTALLAGFLASQVVRLRLRLKRSQRITVGPLFETVVSVGRSLKIRRSPWVYVSSESESPCAGGVFQKFVLLPGWVNLLTQEERRVLVAHELAHLKRWDTFCNWFQILSQVWLWWNPAVWWLNSRIRAERELCCDDLVLSLGFAAGGDYSRLLVDVASRQQNPELAFEAMGMADSFRRLKERIDRAMDSSLRRRTRLSLVSAAVLVAIAVAVLPGTRINSQSIPVASQTGTNEKADTTANAAEGEELQSAGEVTSATGPSIEIDLSLLEFPAHSERDEAFWKRLSEARILPLGEDDSHPIAIVSQDPDLSQLDQILANDSGIKKLSSPRVRTFAGQKASITIGQDVPYTSRYEVVKDAKGVESASPVIEHTSSGIFIGIQPKVNENQQINLNLHLKWSITADPEMVSNPLTGKEEPVGNPLTVLVDNDVKFDVASSKSVAISMPLRSGDLRKLVVLVTARILPAEEVEKKKQEEMGKTFEPAFPPFNLPDKTETGMDIRNYIIPPKGCSISMIMEGDHNVYLYQAPVSGTNEFIKVSMGLINRGNEGPEILARADRIKYNDKTDSATAEGKCVVEIPGYVRVESNGMTFDKRTQSLRIFGKPRVIHHHPDGTTSTVTPESATVTFNATGIAALKMTDPIYTKTAAPRKFSLFLQLIQIQCPGAEEEHIHTIMEGFSKSPVEVREWSPFRIEPASQTVVSGEPWIRNCSTIVKSVDAIAQLADVRVLTAPKLLLMMGQTGEISITPNGVGAKVITSSTSTHSEETPTFTFSARVDPLENGEMLLRLEPSLSLPNPPAKPNIRKGLVVLPVRSSDKLLIDNLIDHQGLGLPGWGTYPNETGQISKWLLTVWIEETIADRGK